MKKIFISLFTVLFLLLSVGCGIQNDTTDTEHKTEDINAMLQKYGIEFMLDTKGRFEKTADEEGIDILNLPNAKGSIRISLSGECVDYLGEIDEELFISAGKKIFSEVAEGENPYLSISVDGENYLYLFGEVVRDIDPPETEMYDGEIIFSGSGIDHDHLYFRERISAKPISD